MPVHAAHKPRGITPLELVNKLKSSNPALSNLPVAYAGRLDPMADGLMLLLSGEDTKKRSGFERLPKEYIFEAAFGFRTDTYDLLGIPERQIPFELPDTGSIRAVVAGMLGTWNQPYPPYSSARVRGKPLFWWARAGRLAEITVPEKAVTIERLELGELKTVSSGVFLKFVEEAIQPVTGDFRQEVILTSWRELLTTAPEAIQTAGFTVSCTSGTYVRSLVERMGRELGCGAVTTRITRTRIGSYTLEDAEEVIFTSTR
ncbi:MAG: hypothetical protein N2691_05170 [Patescibacteria group bacterium]|nr:hypothetical protein [Patescibacteria group bacterium]